MKYVYKYSFERSLVARKWVYNIETNIQETGHEDANAITLDHNRVHWKAFVNIRLS